MQIDNWEDEENLDNELASAHAQHFFNRTQFNDFEIKWYSTELQP